MQEKRELSHDLTVLLCQLVMQNQIVMAAHVLKTYFLRVWKIDEELATRYARGYFAKYYPKQMERHLKRLKKTS